MLSSHLRLGLPTGIFPSGFPTESLYACLICPMRTICLTHFILHTALYLFIIECVVTSLQRLLNIQARVQSQDSVCVLDTVPSHRPQLCTGLWTGSSYDYLHVPLSQYVTRHHATNTYEGSGGIAPRILNLGKMEVSGQLHAPAAVPRWKSPWYPFVRREHVAHFCIREVLGSVLGLEAGYCDDVSRSFPHSLESWVLGQYFKLYRGLPLLLSFIAVYRLYLKKRQYIKKQEFL